MIMSRNGTVAELLEVAAAGQPERVRHWIGLHELPVVRTVLLGLREQMLHLVRQDGALCRRVLHAVLPVLAVPELDLYAVFLAFLGAAARVEDGGDELSESAVRLAATSKAGGSGSRPSPSNRSQ